LFWCRLTAPVNACAVEQRLPDADRPRSGLAPGAAPRGASCMEES